MFAMSEFADAPEQGDTPDGDPKEIATKIVVRAAIVVLCLLLIPATAVATAAAKQRFADGPNQVFSGGALEAGELYAGAEPDWSVVSRVTTIELQLLDPPQSRRIWTAEYDGKLYVWSGYMSTTVGRLWKHWPIQAERDGRAVIRIDGIRLTFWTASPPPLPASTRRRRPERLWRPVVPGCSKRHQGTDEHGGHGVKYFYLSVAVAVLVTMLAVLFIPGVGDWIEQTMLGYLGRAAR